MGRSGVAGSLFDTGTRSNTGVRGMNGGTDGMIGMKSTRHRNTTHVDGTGNGAVLGLGTGTGAAVVDNVPQKVKDEISKAVKKTAPHIRNVHVSGHQEFVTHVSNYATHSRSGATLQGYVTDFEALVNRIFPGRAGTMTGPSGYRNTTDGVGTQKTTDGISGGFSGGVTR
ncbi:Lipoprotein YhcN precursor [compost metagenome]